jgi:hypothetical protein
METILIIKNIDMEIARLQQARTVLTNASTMVKRGPGRPRKELAGVTRQPILKGTRAAVTATPAKRMMSEEGRARIAAAQKLRRAKSKRAAKKAAKVVGSAV